MQWQLSKKALGIVTQQSISLHLSNASVPKPLKLLTKCKKLDGVRVNNHFRFIV